ncbi:MAG: carbamoyltransferase C-terminal domain-containing protein [Patescibacteria group bacterium]
MDKSIYILGLNTTYHELSACLVKNGELVAAVEEERFNRIKHGKPALVSNPNTLPVEAINFCLSKAKINFSDLDKIAISFCPQDRLKNINIDEYFTEGDWGSKSGEELFYKKLMSLPSLLSKLANLDVRDKIVWVPHHIGHAGSAYYVSPFDNAAILSVDGIGEITSTWLGVGNKNKISKIKEIEYPHSIGFLWEKFSKFLGFSEYDAAKVMGLASYGNKEKFYPLFQRIVTILPDGDFKMDSDILQFRLNNFEPIEKLFGVKKIDSPEKRSKSHEDIAAGLQAITNDLILNIAKFLAEKTRSKNICLAGGVALNCIVNSKIMESGYFENMYIQPAAHDAGTALGAAYYIWNDGLSNEKRFVMDNAYWGPDYSDEQIEEVLNEERVKFSKIDNIEEATAKLISEGKIIGWFQNKMEWGPRALGNRSLLADPRDAKIKEVLNMRIKKRESFRPFAPSVLEEDVNDWFELPKNCKSISTEFMEFTFPVKESKKNLIPAVTHIDGTSRIQVATKKSNLKYHKLISEFKKITGVPMVLNTSFNENEPIVCSPTDAVKTFKRTRMDYLAIHDFLVSKEE